MTVGLSYLGDTSRVRIAISARPNGAVSVERSTNQLFWQFVRGGLALPLLGGAAILDDWEFADSVQNFYRVTQIALEDAVDVFIASGTWNKPPGLTAARITVIGSGGGGGGAGATAAGETSVGSGGGAGVTSISVIDAVLLGASETVTVPTGGAGGVGALVGANGAASSFGTHVIANGGGGGAVTAVGTTFSRAFGGSSGTGGTGQVVLPGAPGDAALRIPPTSSLPNGGVSSLAGGGRSGGNSNGLPGSFGSGGGGAANLASNVARTGGAGGNGLVLVEHIFAD